MHFNCNRILYINIDTFKKRNFETIIYYLKKNVNSKKSTRKDIKLILFLSCLLNNAKSCYYSIELEIAKLI